MPDVDLQDVMAEGEFLQRVGDELVGSAGPVGPPGSLSPRTLATQATVASTAALTDAGCYITFTGTSPTYTIPTNATVAFPLGTEIDGTATATAMTIVAAGGVTIRKARTLVTVGALSGWALIKTGTDTWDCHGDFV